MKAKNFLPLVFLFLNSFLFSQSNEIVLGFTGCYPINWEDTTYNHTSQFKWQWYKELNMNFWSGWLVEGYHQNVKDSLVANNIYGLFQPNNIILKAAYGRISIYEAETTFDRFRYDNHHSKGTNYNDNGTLVRFYETVPSNPIGSLALSELWENCEQVFTGLGIPVTGDSLEWYIKPRMRITTDDAFGTKQEVVKIIIYNYGGGFVDSVTIYTDDFRHTNDTTYDGRYLEDYLLHNMVILADSLTQGANYDNPYEPGLLDSDVDYQIYWYGSVNLWIDYVKVMDNVAHDFLNPNDDKIRDSIQYEISQLNSFNNFRGFFTEEIAYNNLRCLKALQDSIAVWSGNNPNAKVVCLINDYSFQYNLKTRHQTDYADYLDMVNPPYMLAAWYHFEGQYGIPGKLPDVLTTNNFQYTPQAIRNEIDSFLTSIKISKTAYQTYVQDIFNRYSDTVSKYMALCTTRSKRLFMGPQMQYFKAPYGNAPPQTVSAREPTNPEINVEYGIALCNGATGFLPYAFESWYAPPSITNGKHHYMFGMLDSSEFNPPQNHAITMLTKRTTNFYGEKKWENYVDLHSKIKKWDSVIANSTNTHGYSVHLDGANHEYIWDIMSIVPYRNGQNPCQEDAFPSGPYCDCPEERYWEMGFFSTTEPNTKYFMMVNRRCIPKAGTGSDTSGDTRVLRIKFNLSGPNNWTLQDVVTRQSKIFNRYDEYIDLGSTYGGLGWFQPGESKLYRLSLTAKTGGIFVTNEDLSNQTVTCEDTVWNGGYNVTIDSGTTLSFRDSATIIMNGGTFQSGIHGSPSNQLVTYKGVGSSDWKGLRFSETNVKIYNSKFQDISSPCINYAIRMVDCQPVDIRTNQFVMDTDTAGAIQSVYIENPFGSPSYSGLYINYNNISMGNSRNNAICVQGFSGITLPFYAMNNTMTSNGNSSGIMLSTVTGGVIKNNSISGFSTGLNIMFSTVDLYGNTISNTSAQSKSILGTSSSTISLVPSGNLWIGGFNSITNTSGTSKNIDVSSSLFYLDGGKNTFDLTNTSGAYHLYGTFSSAGSSNQQYNCFKLAGSTIVNPNSPANYVTDGSSQIAFDFFDYTCGATPPSNTTVVDIGNGLYDTIPTSSGEGGSISSRYYVVSVAQLYDSINIQLIYRNYGTVKNLCYELIDDFPNSFESIPTLQMLYMAATSTDTSSASITALKNYYENLILENGSNETLVKISNYLVQKCKVLLRQYSSALTGFQNIINENQYNYEGLLARWDYMATSLLMQGQGGACKGDNEEGDDDKSPLSKEQRKLVRETISFINEKNRNYTEARVRTLEEMTKSGNTDAEKELNGMKTLRSVIKSERPKDLFDHIRIVNSDIQKVFGSTVDNSKNTENNIPSVFGLSQNYPNPFNPVTKINYDLPKDSKVTLVIYDILGRELKKLVNNEIKSAGRYIIEFNAQNYASGVYFYRIEAEEVNGTKHVDAKKMVLVK